MNKLLDFFKILSDETRFRIVMLLYKKELCVCEICDILQISQPKASKHLAKLRDMGFVGNKRKSQWIFYYLTLDEGVMNDIVEKIVKNSSYYPVIREDLNRLGDRKADYKQLCKEKKS